MNIKRKYPVITISEKGEDFINSGNNWVYENEILKNDSHQNGEIVDVLSKKGKYLGSGFISDLSKIRVRIFSHNTNDVYDYAFFKRRIKYALDYRISVLDNIESCRIIFGEADGFPGLTVDKYNDILVTQITTIGIEKRKGLMVRCSLYT